MKKFSIVLFALLALFGVSKAQVSGLSIGYCVGELGTNPSGYNSTVSGDQVSAAIFVPADQVRAYAGNHIDEIRIGLASKLNVNSLKVWLRSSLTGDDLASTTIESGILKGWNTVKLDTPFDITNTTSGLYIGYTYTQKNTSKAMAVVELPQANALFTKMGTNAEWTDRSEDGTLSIEAMVYGDNLPKYNLSLISITTQKVFVVDKGTFKASLLVRNVAQQTISSYDVVCSVDGLSDTYAYHVDEPIAYGEVKEVEATFTLSGITSNNPSTRNVTLTIDNLAEGNDEAMSDNSLQASLQVVNHDFTRVPLIEEFTTEKCSNCPRVAGYLHHAAEDERFAGRFNSVEHHAGYYTDVYTIPADTQWEWFYDNVYAPAVMLDRAPEFGDVSQTSVYCPSSQNQFDNYLLRELQKSAFVSLKIDVVPSEADYTLDITVTGERSKSDLTKNPARITVMLTETNLVTTNQAGFSGNYVHVNVGRRVNAIWGEELQWQGDTYTYHCTLGYSPSYVKDNMGILAFIHDGDRSDKLSWEVCNSASTKVFNGNSELGISNTVNASGDAVRYYDLRGNEYKTPQPGINIVKQGNGVRKIFSK